MWESLLFGCFSGLRYLVLCLALVCARVAPLLRCMLYFMLSFRWGSYVVTLFLWFACIMIVELLLCLFAGGELC